MTLEKVPEEELILNNYLGKSCVAEVQQGSKNVPLIHIGMEKHKHLTNHFNEKLNVKIFDTFTELFSNINVDNIQETYPKINVYNKVITQYTKETNVKYGLNLKFTKLEALEVGLWARTFQVTSHEEGPQLPGEQRSEPPKPQPPQHTIIPPNELPVTEQQLETGQKTSMATQWSHSTPVVLSIMGGRNRLHRQQDGQGQLGIEHVSIHGQWPTQANIDGSFSQPYPCCPASVNTVNVSHSYSLRQVLMQTAINSIQEFNGTHTEATISWLDHINSIVKKMGFDPVEVGMSKLKVSVLHDVNAASKEGTLSYFWFCQLLIEHYSNIPYASDTLNAYIHLAQGKHELIV